MRVLQLFAVLISLMALLAVVNARWLRLPTTIAMTVGGLVVSILLSGLATGGLPIAQDAITGIRSIEFDQVVFVWLLSFLLFAGALGIDSHELWQARIPVATLALLTTSISIILVGFGMYYLLQLLGLGVPLVYALLFGALISPTDPVAVLGILKHMRISSRVETVVAGESLFNDGVGVVAVGALSALAFGGSHSTGLSGPALVGLMLREVGGGIALGMVLGWVGLWLIRQVDDFITESLVSLALVFALTAAALSLHVSAPLTAVTAGLLVGGLTDRDHEVLSSKERFTDLWNLLDELLNLALFALLAFEVVAVDFVRLDFVAGVAAIAVVVAARVVSVRLPLLMLQRHYAFTPQARLLMVWAGIRGALSVALAFTLPPSNTRNLILVMTYCVVVFSIVVQGLSIPRVARRLNPNPIMSD